MDAKSLKTSWWTRVVIIAVAIILLGSTMLAYMFIVMGSNGSNSASSSNVNELYDAYTAKSAELDEAAKPFSDKYFSEFAKYRSEVQAYNEANANANGLQTKDLKVGTGRTIEKDDTNYLAYYVGWCADGSIFDSSFDNNELSEATALKSPISVNSGVIDGWAQGIIGAKIGGIRQISIPKELAYGDTMEVCGGYNTPLRFIVMPIEYDENIATLSQEVQLAYLEWLYANYYGQGSY